MHDAPDPDPHAWLEAIDDERALAWVRERNAESQAELTARPEYAALLPRLRALLDAQDRIPYVSRMGDHLYNFWQDGAHPRGLWRRTPLAGYRQADPPWEVVLDLDRLGAAEGENWVWGGAAALPPTPGQPWRRCLVHLSRGGADAHVVREFDLQALAFVADGFVLPEAKSDAAWCDADTLYVGTDTGPGSLTDSGYPRVVRRWRRGTPLAAAEAVFEGIASDVSAWVQVHHTPGFERTVFGRSIDFYRTEAFVLDGAALRRLAKPDDASLSLHREWALLHLRSDFAHGGRTHAQGSLLVAPADAVLAGPPEAVDWAVLFAPTPGRSLDGWAWTRDHLLLTVLDQVVNRIEELRCPLQPQDGWTRRDVPVPGLGALGISALRDPFALDDPWAEHYWLSYADFLTPDTLLLAQAGSDARETVKQRTAQFDATGLRVEQRFARSADGTRVPYFLVWPRGAGPGAPSPTLLYGYGGFEVSMQPWYSGAYGAAWFERGGVLAVANIRGGGEFGPGWHQAATGAHKQRSFDDFLAVAEDLIAQGVCTPATLGIMGGSNGGLLVGAAYTQRPELFGAVVCQVPLLDMRRYHRLLAGASWMAEYGDPDDPEQWAWIGRYSPYHQLRAGRPYCRALFTTSTRDDRVHPAHARKMVARLRELGCPVLYYENIEGGHGGAADNAQRAHLLALEFAYLWGAVGRGVMNHPPVSSTRPTLTATLSRLAGEGERIPSPSGRGPG